MSDADGAQLERTLQAALRHHQAGELQRAETLYRQVLAAHPDQPEALHYLGLLAHQAGQHEPAWELMRRAIAVFPASAVFHCNAAPVALALGRHELAEQLCRHALALRPEYPEALNNLATALRAAERWEEAIACCRRAIALRPNYAEPRHNLGVALIQKGQLEEAIDALRSALAQRPNYPEALNALGIALKRRGDVDEAIACFRKALSLRPQFPEALTALAGALQERGEFDEAIDCAKRVVALKPDSAAAHNNLGVALKFAGRVDEAVACYERAAQLDPASAQVHNNLGVAHREKRRVDEAIDSFRRAVALNPTDAEAISNLATGLKDAGLVREAVECYRRALALKSDYRVASNLLYTMHFDPECDAERLWAEHVKWYETFARPLEAEIVAHPIAPASERRLRVGYVSPDFRDHPIGRFMLPLLSHHDRGRFEVFCYSDLTRPDDVAAQIRPHVDAWRDTAALSDHRLARLVRDDRIDILVDLTMHMAGTRLLTFARKPAPVQVTYLAYCGTTGLRTIDYRLTDPRMDPEDGDERFYSERSVRLASYWCYPPPADSPEVQPPPARSAGFTTFGCLNNFCKVSPSVLEAWCGLLRAVPGSRLLLHANPGAHRERIRAAAQNQGVSGDRIEFVGSLPLRAYLEQYNRIDVALDPFPYPGGTTSCDALWMGVPLVTLPGSTALSRGGLSILANLGLTDLVARNLADYTDIVRQLSADPPRLARLRSTLRQRMLASPLMDADAFARNVEEAYLRMWNDRGE